MLKIPFGHYAQSHFLGLFLITTILFTALYSLNYSYAEKYSDAIGSERASIKLLQMEANEGLFIANGILSCIHSPMNSGAPCDLHFTDSGTGAEFSIEPHREAFQITASGKTQVLLKGRLNLRGVLEIVNVAKK